MDEGLVVGGLEAEAAVLVFDADGVGGEGGGGGEGEVLDEDVAGGAEDDFGGDGVAAAAEPGVVGELDDELAGDVLVVDCAGTWVQIIPQPGNDVVRVAAIGKGCVAQVVVIGRRSKTDESVGTDVEFGVGFAEVGEVKADGEGADVVVVTEAEDGRARAGNIHPVERRSARLVAAAEDVVHAGSAAYRTHRRQIPGQVAFARIRHEQRNLAAVTADEGFADHGRGQVRHGQP